MGEALAAFFPWADPTLSSSSSANLAIPSSRCEWPIPPVSQKVAIVAGILNVDLEHCSTGIVFEPLEVKVRVRGGGNRSQELKVQVLWSEGGEGADKFFVGGTTSTQAVLGPMPDTE